MIFRTVALAHGLVALAMLFTLNACGFVDSGGSPALSRRLIARATELLEAVAARRQGDC